MNHTIDAVVVGAGMAGLYMTHRLHEQGRTVMGIDTADDVGGTWYWNRYPGARCDVPTTDYTYSFDAQLDDEWEWSEKYATQPEILRYLGHVADRFDLRRHYRFGTTLDRATWDDDDRYWTVALTSPDDGDSVSARHLIMATGCLSVPKQPELANADGFAGDVYLTGRWPHDGVDFSGLRVAVVGTGSSGIQSIPIIAEQADSLTVFQRTPNYSMPARNSATWPMGAERIATDRDAYRNEAKWSTAGMAVPAAVERVDQLDADELQRRYEEAWAMGHLLAPGMQVSNLLTDEAANDTFAEFVRNKIRTTVDDPAVAEALCPVDYPYGTKRPCLDSGYYETFNLDHVELVNLKREPIAAVTERGIDTIDREFEFDAIVYATGFDAMTGAIVGVDIRGRHGEQLADKWAAGPETYLGLMSSGFPNLFMITGPGSPSVLSNMAVSIEQHVDWIADALADLERDGFDTIEPTARAEEAWGEHVDAAAGMTLFEQTDSWYMGANVPGKARRMLPFPAGVGLYRSYCDRAVDEGYLGFTRTGGDDAVTNDGVVAAQQPDVRILLNLMAELGAPPLESMSPDELRAFNALTQQGRPTGPEVAEVTDFTIDADGVDLTCRRYRPDGDGHFPVVVYFHGGGWVFGDHASDDPLCRELCVESGAIIVSVGYRHGPEARFPAAVDDAWAATQWVAEHAAEFDGDPERLAVAGWSAGGNLAAVVTQMARNAGGPSLQTQALITPVTDADFGRESYDSNGDGYILTRALMEWFFDHYVDESDRDDPRVAPIRGDLHGVPPALLVTCEFDPLRDGGDAYAAALRDAGVEVEHITADGHIHTSLTMVGILPTGAEHRRRVGRYLGEQLRSSETVTS